MAKWQNEWYQLPDTRFRAYHFCQVRINWCGSGGNANIESNLDIGADSIPKGRGAGYCKCILYIRYQASDIAQLYPQPATNFVILQASVMNLLNTKAILIDMHGRPIKQININQLPFRFDLTGLPSGMYHIKLASGEVLKMMKQ